MNKEKKLGLTQSKELTEKEKEDKKKEIKEIDKLINNLGLENLHNEESLNDGRKIFRFEVNADLIVIITLSHSIQGFKNYYELSIDAHDFYVSFKQQEKIDKMIQGLKHERELEEYSEKQQILNKIRKL
jgi:hypothetical protein